MRRRTFISLVGGATALHVIFPSCANAERRPPMAIISGQAPPSEGVPVDYKRRVVVKFRPDVRLSYSAAAAEELALPILN